MPLSRKSRKTKLNERGTAQVRMTWYINCSRLQKCVVFTQFLRIKNAIPLRFRNITPEKSTKSRAHTYVRLTNNMKNILSSDYYVKFKNNKS